MADRVAGEIKFIGLILFSYAAFTLFNQIQFLTIGILHRGLSATSIHDWVLILLFVGSLGLLLMKKWGRVLIILASAIKLFIYLKPLVLAYTSHARNLQVLLRNFWPGTAKFVFIYLILIIIFLCPSVKEEFN